MWVGEWAGHLQQASQRGNFFKILVAHIQSNGRHPRGVTFFLHCMWVGKGWDSAADKCGSCRVSVN